MASKTPRTLIGDYLNASNTQTTKTSRVQSRVVDSPDVPRSPSWVSISKGKMLPVQKLKSPGKSLQHDRVSSLRAKRKIHNLSMTTEEITPRTMVAAFLEGADSTMPVLRQRARTSQTGVATSVPAVLRETRSVSQPMPGGNSDEWGETPRTLIQKFLQNASNSFETPLVSLRRNQQQKNVSPEVSAPRQGSYQTPSPFKSSDKSSDQSTNRSSTRKNIRRTPRPHAPIIVNAPGSKSSTLSRSPDVSESVPGSYQTPSPFKSSMIEDQDTASIEISRKMRRQTHKKTFLLDIPEHMLDMEQPIPDTSNDYASSQGISDQSKQEYGNIPQQNEESMDSVRAEYSYEVDKGLSHNTSTGRSPEPTTEPNQDESHEYSHDPEDPIDENSDDQSVNSEMAEKSYNIYGVDDGSDDQEGDDQPALKENESLTVGKEFHEAQNEHSHFVLNKSRDISNKRLNHPTAIQGDPVEDLSEDRPDVGHDFIPNQSAGEHSNFVENQSKPGHTSFALNKSKSIHNSSSSNQSKSFVNNMASNQSTIVPENFVPAFTSTQQPQEARDEEEIEDDGMDIENEEADEPVVQPKKKTVRWPRKKSNYSMPVTLVKKQFTHFTGMRVDKDAMEEVMKVSEVYWDNVCHDLLAYAKHAGRKTITMADCHLLFKRQGLVHEKQCLYSLIEKFLPMEERRKLIPVARAGNRIELL